MWILRHAKIRYSATLIQNILLSCSKAFYTANIPNYIQQAKHCFNTRLLGMLLHGLLHHGLASSTFFLFIEQIKYNVILTLFWKAGASCITIFLLEPQKTLWFQIQSFGAKKCHAMKCKFCAKKRVCWPSSKQ